MRVVLTVAGSDSSAGAGIQADLKAIAANGAYAVTAITAVTAQSRRRFGGSMPVAPALIRAQIDAAFEDVHIAAAKTGMLATAQIVQTVAEALAEHRPRHIVVDPVLVTTSGASLLEPDAVEVLRRRLLPLASLVTPNVPEAEALTGIAITTLGDAEAAARALLDMGAAAALVKGGHLREAPATDVLVTPEGVEIVEGEFIDTPYVHGTGCTLSAAITARLAHGDTLPDAVVRAKAYVTEAIRGGLQTGPATRSLDHFLSARRAAEAGAR